MTNEIRSISIDKLIAHPDNPNRMSKANFAKLIRNIKRTGRYEPLIVRPHPNHPQARLPKGSSVGQAYQIINGHHRWRALRELGYKNADAIIWDVDNEQADIFLATLNRLEGSDVLDKKLALLKRLNESAFGGQTRLPKGSSVGQARELAKLLPQTKKQIERLTNLKLPRVTSIGQRASSFANPLVFFVTDQQQQIIEKALSIVRQTQKEKTKAAKNAAALTVIAQSYIAGDPHHRGDG